MCMVLYKTHGLGQWFSTFSESGCPSITVLTGVVLPVENYCCAQLTSAVPNWVLLLPSKTVLQAYCTARPGRAVVYVHAPPTLGFSEKPKVGKRTGSCCNLSQFDPAQCLLETEACGTTPLILHVSISGRSIVG